MKILEFLERAVALRRRYAPPVPKLDVFESKSLRQIFEANDREALQLLFGRGLFVGLDRACKLFHPLDLNRLIDSGLLFEKNRGIKSRFQAQHYGGLIFFSDFFQWESDPDFVLPIGPAGNYLALLTIRRQVKSTLDLGCGCGVQSLLAARHSDKVIATDINPRALALTRFNAELNDIHNIETRQGNYFEPVNEQSFDLIVANLPYVITPEKRLVYRTVDRPGDAGTHERLKEIPAYLKDGGFAQILINWIHGKDQEPSEPIRRTIEGRYVNAWLIHNASKQPLQYARMWLNHGNRSNPRKLQKTEQRWLRWYRSHHIDQIALGAIILRRRSSQRNWFCSATVGRRLEDAAGGQLLRLFAGQDYLGRMANPELLLNEIFTLVESDFSGTEKLPVAYARHGLRFELNISAVSKSVLQELDGKNTIEKAIQAVSQNSEMEAKQIQHEVLETFMDLLRLGMIRPQAA